MAKIVSSGMSVRNLTMKMYKEALILSMNTRLKAVEANDMECNLPLFVWGSIGVGKSAIISAVCMDTWVNAKTKAGKEMFDGELLKRLRPWDSSNWHFYTETERKEFDKNPEGWLLMDVRLSQVDPVEIKGAPFYDTVNQRASFIRFSSILPDPDNNHPTFLFLDELVLAPDMIQAAAYQLINERKVGDYRLPERCVTVAASNPPSMNMNTFEMAIALENRFDHISLDIDYPGFLKYIGRGEHGYDETMVAFLQYSSTQDKDTLYHIENQQGKGNFPTFRSWEKALKKVKYGHKEYSAVADSCGQACATKFEQFKETTKDIPNADTLVNKKMYYKDIALQLVASQKVGNQLLNKDSMDKLTVERSWEMFKYFVDMKDPDDKTNNREELTILFLVNLRDNMEVLDKIDRGFQKALKSGKVKMEKNSEGVVIADIYAVIFSKWTLLTEVD